MVTFDGKEDWVSFEIPFKRIASRAGWPEEECLQQLYQCLRGDAMKFVGGLTSAVQNDYTMMMIITETAIWRQSSARDI